MYIHNLIQWSDTQKNSLIFSVNFTRILPLRKLYCRGALSQISCAYYALHLDILCQCHARLMNVDWLGQGLPHKGQMLESSPWSAFCSCSLARGERRRGALFFCTVMEAWKAKTNRKRGCSPASYCQLQEMVYVTFILQELSLLNSRMAFRVWILGYPCRLYMVLPIIHHWWWFAHTFNCTLIRCVLIRLYKHIGINVRSWNI